MNRKITELEQRLINNGYRLSHKQYGGRHSEKTLSYYYVKNDQFVRLDYKREQVLSLGLTNYQCRELTRMECEGIRLKLYNIEQDIHREPTLCVSTPNDNDEEIVDYIKSSTPEQLDELCKEN